MHQVAIGVGIAYRNQSKGYRAHGSGAGRTRSRRIYYLKDPAGSSCLEPNRKVRTFHEFLGWWRTQTPKAAHTVLGALVVLCVRVCARWKGLCDPSAR